MRRILPGLVQVNRRFVQLRKARVLMAVALLLTAEAALQGMVPALAQLEQGYDLRWWTVDCGGGALLGSGPAGTYELAGTMGQPDVGDLQGGDYVLAGGLWGGGEVAGRKYHVYLPVVMRDW